MKKHENLAADSLSDQELSIAKFTQIPGISRKIAKAFYDVGLHNYGDLINYLDNHTTEELSKALRGQGISRRPGSINKELWLDQARRLVEAEIGIPSQKNSVAQKERRSKPAPSNLEARRHASVFTISFDVAKDNSGGLASSITVYNENNGGEEQVFQAMDTTEWVNWILERTNLPLSRRNIAPQDSIAEEKTISETSTAIRSERKEDLDVQIEICDFQISTTRPTPKTPENRLKTVMSIRLSGVDAEKMAQQGMLYRTEIYTIETDSGFPRMVGTREDHFKPHVLDYSNHFEVAMPEVGRYEFHSVVRLLPSGQLKAYRQGPIMRVAP